MRIAGRDLVTLDATSVPAGQFVEIDTTFPRRLLAADGNFTSRSGNGLHEVVDREKRIFASPFGPGSGPVATPSGGGGSWLTSWLWVLLFPLALVARLFGFGRSSGD